MSSENIYEDFVIRLGRDSGSGHEVVVDSTVGGEGSGVLQLPFSQDELASLASSEKSWSEPNGGMGLQKLGRKLYDALFADQVNKLFIDSRARAEMRQHKLRILLRFDLKDPTVQRLASLPWELMRSPNGRFLVLSDQTPLIRYLELALPRSDSPKVDRLSVLAVLAAPKDQRPLKLEKEWEGIESALKDETAVRLRCLKNPTIDEFSDFLERQEVHVLHFMGHGGFHSEHKAWGLCFSDETSSTHFVSADSLAEEMLDLRSSLRLVILNACQTGRLTPSDAVGNTLGAGVATSLVAAGIQGVVATQAVISDEAAIRLSEHLYKNLAAGDPLGRAMARTRRAVKRSEGKNGIWAGEWATPVVFLRGRIDRLFEVGKKPGIGKDNGTEDQKIRRDDETSLSPPRTLERVDARTAYLLAQRILNDTSSLLSGEMPPSLDLHLGFAGRVRVTLNAEMLGYSDQLRILSLIAERIPELERQIKFYKKKQDQAAMALHDLEGEIRDREQRLEKIRVELLDQLKFYILEFHTARPAGAKSTLQR